MAEDHDHFMSIALDDARRSDALGRRPIAAVVVKQGEVVGKGQNSVDAELDPSCHAEIVAIRHACQSLGTIDLSGTTIYTVLEPCPMCLWAIHKSKIGRLVLGGRHANLNRSDLGDYSVGKLLELTHQRIELVTGVMEKECEALRRAWQEKTGQY